MNDLKEENDELNRKNQELVDKAANTFKKQENINQLLRNVSNQSDIEELKRKNEELKTKNEDLLTENEELRTKVLTLEVNSRNLTGKSGAMKEEIASLEKKIKELEQFNADLKQKIPDFQSNRSLEDKIDSLENMLREKDKRIQELGNKAEIGKQYLEADSWKDAEINRLSQVNKVLNSQIATLSEKDTAHEKSVKELSENIEKEIIQFIQKLRSEGFAGSEPSRPYLKNVAIEKKVESLRGYLNGVKLSTREKIIKEAFIDILIENNMPAPYNSPLEELRAKISSKLTLKSSSEEKRIEAEPAQKPKPKIIRSNDVPIYGQRVETRTEEKKIEVVEPAHKPKPKIIHSEEALNIDQKGGAGKKGLLNECITPGKAEEVTVVKKKVKPTIIEETGQNNIQTIDPNALKKKGIQILSTNH